MTGFAAGLAAGFQTGFFVFPFRFGGRFLTGTAALPRYFSCRSRARVAPGSHLGTA